MYCIYVYNNWYVLCFSVDCLLIGLRWNIKYGHMFQLSTFQPFSSLYRPNFLSIPESKATEERILPYGMKLYRHRPVNNKYYLAVSLLTWFAWICLKPQFFFFSEFNNCPTRYDLFGLLHFCRQFYMFQVLTPIIRSWYSCNYGFWYWLTVMNKIRCY